MERRRILIDGVPTDVVRDGDELVADDGRRVAIDGAVHLPPVQPTKIVCVHLNYESRRAEFLSTHFHRHPADVYLYDLLLNSSLLGEDLCAELIAQAARAKFAAWAAARCP